MSGERIRTKDLTDAMVCAAYIEARACRDAGGKLWPYEVLERTGACEKVVWAAMERAARRGLIDYGVSLRTGWLTDKGRAIAERVIAEEER